MWLKLHRTDGTAIILSRRYITAVEPKPPVWKGGDATYVVVGSIGYEVAESFEEVLAMLEASNG